MHRPASSVNLPELRAETTFEHVSSVRPNILRTVQLEDEVNKLVREGYNVSIGDTYDPAYENPGMIKDMMRLIDYRDVEFERRKNRIAQSEMAGAALLLTGSRKRENQKNIYGLLEPHRGELILDGAKAWPWHNQRGCATALLTITSAHELIVDDRPDDLSGVYPTMSGPLDETVLRHRFGKANSLSGLDLRQALINAGQRFRNKTEVEAAQSADKSIDKLQDFLYAPVTSEFKDIVKYCSDSLGIRSRKEEVGRTIESYVRETVSSDTARDFKKDKILMMSFGCGTALPMLETVAKLKEEGTPSTLILLDQDPIALASASVLAQKMNLEDVVEIHCERLFSKIGRPIAVQQVLKGRQLDVCEDSGLREYLPDGVYKGLTKEAWDNLRKGGLMTTGNMNRNRAQPEFLHGLMGWTPQVQMRTINEGIRLHVRAGIPKNAMDIRVTQDGIYTMYFSLKPK